MIINCENTAPVLTFKKQSEINPLAFRTVVFCPEGTYFDDVDDFNDVAKWVEKKASLTIVNNIVEVAEKFEPTQMLKSFLGFSYVGKEARPGWQFSVYSDIDNYKELEKLTNNGYECYFIDENNNKYGQLGISDRIYPFKTSCISFEAPKYGLPTLQFGQLYVELSDNFSNLICENSFDLEDLNLDESYITNITYPNDNEVKFKLQYLNGIGIENYEFDKVYINDSVNGYLEATVTEQTDGFYLATFAHALNEGLIYFDKFCIGYKNTVTNNFAFIFDSNYQLRLTVGINGYQFNKDLIKFYDNKVIDIDTIEEINDGVYLISVNGFISVGSVKFEQLGISVGYKNELYVADQPDYYFDIYSKTDTELVLSVIDRSGFFVPVEAINLTSFSNTHEGTTIHECAATLDEANQRVSFVITDSIFGIGSISILLNNFEVHYNFNYTMETDIFDQYNKVGTYVFFNRYSKNNAAISPILHASIIDNIYGASENVSIGGSVGDLSWFSISCSDFTPTSGSISIVDETNEVHTLSYKSSDLFYLSQCLKFDSTSIKFKIRKYGQFAPITNLTGLTFKAFSYDDTELTITNVQVISGSYIKITLSSAIDANGYVVMSGGLEGSINFVN